ncbi:MAG: aminopeptidase P family protein, partial [Betaproteobacteria bacterium]|nr:aminopeptidase P family protein [Betaproteobacteria bacterium]
MPYDYDAALNMHLLGPGEPALSEWRALGLELPDMDAVRAYRLARVRGELKKRNIAAAVLFDPLNIRYATDSTNMQLWIAHNAARYCFVAAEGPVIVFDYHQCEHLSAHNPLVDEVRPAQSWFYFSAGAGLDKKAKRWAGAIAELTKKAGGDVLAADKLNPQGAKYLRALGIKTVCGEEVMERARMIKCADEIRAMRCAIAACDAAINVMRQHARPGVSENRLWAHLHAENIARGGEWIETRILSAGPRTNPWFQESSSRPVRAGELLAFDTDLIGAYGMCVDISRTWLVGAKKPSPAQEDLHRRAAEQVRHNAELLRPGMSWRELAEKALAYPPEIYRHYSSIAHGVGLCDEYPSAPFLHQWDEDAPLEGGILPGMALCAESYVGRRDGGEGAKYEEQYLITETGAELLSHYPA